MKIKQWIIEKLDNFFLRDDGKQDFCTASPDVVFGVDIGEICCYNHDVHYWYQEISRKEADLIFRDCIYEHFKAKNKKIRGWIVCRIYYYAVRWFARY